MHFLHPNHTRNGVNAAQKRFIPRGSRHLWRDPESGNPQSENPEMHFCILASGPHQKWCELFRKNVPSRVVHAISGVVRNPESEIQKSRNQEPTTIRNPKERDK